VKREFDMQTKTFVKDGFFLPEAKSSVTWIDKDNLFIGTDFGSDSLTQSGYPNEVRLLQRGQLYKEARLIFAGDKTDVSSGAFRVLTPDADELFIVQAQSFHTARYYHVQNHKPVPLSLPEDFDVEGMFKGFLLCKNKKALTHKSRTIVKGSLVAVPFQSLLAGEVDFQVVYAPDERSSYQYSVESGKRLFVAALTDVNSKFYEVSLVQQSWRLTEVPIPSPGTFDVVSSHLTNGSFFYSFDNFLTPNTLFFVDTTGEHSKITSQKSYFKTNDLTVSQRFAKSKDGTRVPYFMVYPKNMRRDGSNKTLLYGYGGFEVSLKPGYSAINGMNWLEKGNVYVLANIRGGGEYGPKWHQAALQTNRTKAFEDFEAIAEDLIRQKITSPAQLGIQGGSNGGLLVGSVSVRRPELFKAVVCSVPLLDMRRYHKLLAGNSWMAEYGDPDDPQVWERMKTYSPYHNIDPHKSYPRIFITTSTRDDRVHPAHARKMVARLKQLNKPVLYYENIEGGHYGASNNAQIAHLMALQFAYLDMELSH
ncbi:MAG: prolyl oligopeptidase family serine peptidase, partial [Myxococcota bacterium]